MPTDDRSACRRSKGGAYDDLIADPVRDALIRINWTGCPVRYGVHSPIGSEVLSWNRACNRWRGARWLRWI